MIPEVTIAENIQRVFSPHIRHRISKSRKNRKFKRRMTKYRMYENYNFKKIESMKTNESVFLGSSDFMEHITSNIHLKRNEEGKETFYESVSVFAIASEWKKYVESMDYRLIQESIESGFLFDDENNNFMDYRIHPTHTTLNIVGDLSFVENESKKILNKFQKVTARIEWIYSSDGQSIDIPLQAERMPIEEMYPFLGEKTLARFYEDFMNSSASILLLIGPPGTGKTTFIRGMLQHSDISAMVSYDSSILEKDYVFAQFVESDKNILVLEDADMFLKSRKESNTMMHKFLNVGDGLVTMKSKKLVFSTNLPSINEIDPALIRPGRCYDIIKFRELNQEEAEKLANKMNIELKEKKEKWTIAEIFFNRSIPETKKFEHKVGFL